MATNRDIILDENRDLKITNGDFVIRESDQQHIEALIRTAKGHWKEYPLVGVGIAKYMNSSGRDQKIKSDIKLQLESDGYRVKDIIIKDFKYYIDAERI